MIFSNKEKIIFNKYALIKVKDINKKILNGNKPIGNSFK